MKIILRSEDYFKLPEPIHNQISDLVYNTYPQTNHEVPLHPKKFNVRSFYIQTNHDILSYAGVIRWKIQLLHQSFQIVSLSCVVTDEKYRRMGLALKNVASATQWCKQHSGADFGIFTCHQSLIPFYQKAGQWHHAAHIKLFSNNSPHALSSEKLEVAVVVLFFFDKAKKYKNQILESTIYLNFEDQEFI